MNKLTYAFYKTQDKLNSVSSMTVAKVSTVAAIGLSQCVWAKPVLATTVWDSGAADSWVDSIATLYIHWWFVPLILCLVLYGFTHDEKKKAALKTSMITLVAIFLVCCFRDVIQTSIEQLVTDGGGTVS